jgi:hypothetical protein
MPVLVAAFSTVPLTDYAATWAEQNIKMDRNFSIA